MRAVIQRVAQAQVTIDGVVKGAIQTGLVVLLAVAYLLVLAMASTRPSPVVARRESSTRFAIVIPAHDEASVIAATVTRLRSLDYPAELFAIHVVADHCSDETAGLARQAGAVVHERNDGPRTGKGAALAWLFERILDDPYDAVVVFDSDTRVATDFLRVMDSRLAQGAQVVQGQHVIRNPDENHEAFYRYLLRKNLKLPGLAYGIDRSGDVYVTDANNNRVERFTTDGTFVGAWGKAGQTDGRFNYPFGVATATYASPATRNPAVTSVMGTQACRRV